MQSTALKINGVKFLKFISI